MFIADLLALLMSYNTGRTVSHRASDSDKMPSHTHTDDLCPCITCLYSHGISLSYSTDSFEPIVPYSLASCHLCA